MPITLSVDVGNDTRVILVSRQGNTYAKVGVLAEVAEQVRLGGRGFAVSLNGLHRVTLGAASADTNGVLRVDYEEKPDTIPAGNLTRELEREYRVVVDEILDLRGRDPRFARR
jgi:ATP-dependent Lon protease